MIDTKYDAAEETSEWGVRLARSRKYLPSLRKEAQPKPLTNCLGSKYIDDQLGNAEKKLVQTLHPRQAPELASSNGAAERKGCKASLGVL